MEKKIGKCRGWMNCNKEDAPIAYDEVRNEWCCLNCGGTWEDFDPAPVEGSPQYSQEAFEFLVRGA